MTIKKSNSPYGYKKLLVYAKAEELQRACAEITSRFPPFSHSSRSKTISALADQMDRSARSIKQNIIEGWKRNSTREYYDFLGFSLGANAELEEDCNDIIKGIYPTLMGVKGIMGEMGTEKGEMGRAAANGGGTMGEREAQKLHSIPSTQLSLEEVERLPFYPLNTHLPLVVQLKLRCKELNMLLEKLQKSLLEKMSAEHGLSQADKLNHAVQRVKDDDEFLAKMIEDRGLVRLPDGRVVRKEKAPDADKTT